jgi:hypothetical protein
MVRRQSWALLITKTLAIREFLQSIVIAGRVQAREKCPVIEGNTRSILPQPKLLDLMQMVIMLKMAQGVVDYATRLDLNDCVLGVFSWPPGS